MGFEAVGLGFRTSLGLETNFETVIYVNRYPARIGLGFELPWASKLVSKLWSSRISILLQLIRASNQLGPRNHLVVHTNLVRDSNKTYKLTRNHLNNTSKPCFDMKIRETLIRIWYSRNLGSRNPDSIEIFLKTWFELWKHRFTVSILTRNTVSKVIELCVSKTDLLLTKSLLPFKVQLKS